MMKPALLTRAFASIFALSVAAQADARFLQVDPVGYDDQINLYTYVGNDPVNLLDPSGTCKVGGDAWGCEITGRTTGTPLPGIPTIAPNAAVGINAHAVGGDGSARQINFTKVNLSGLGEQIWRTGNTPGSNLNTAISRGFETGQAQSVSITNLSGGGQLGGSSSISQQLGIGRFAVNIAGTVTVSSSGNWSLKGSVTGVTDIQDYPASNRGAAGEAGTSALGSLQNALGGQNYKTTFFGSQAISVTGTSVGQTCKSSVAERVC